MDDKKRLANHIRLVQSLNDLELEVNLVENTLARPNILKAVCLNLSNSLRLNQERNRAILSTIDPNDSAARADTQRYSHLQAKIHELFIVLIDRIDQFPDPTVSSPPPGVPNPLPVKHNLPKISLPNSMRNSLRLNQERNRAILSTVDPNDSAARADTQRYFHLQAKIHELFIVLTNRIDQFPDPTVSSPPPGVPNPLPVKHSLPKISLPNSMRKFLNGRTSGDYTLI